MVTYLDDFGVVGVVVGVAVGVWVGWGVGDGGREEETESTYSFIFSL